MKKLLDVIIFVLLITLVAIANKSFWGLSFDADNKETTKFEPSFNITEILYTKDFAPKIYGFGGHVPIAIGLDASGVIKDIKVLKNSETQEYISQALGSGILNKWIGKNIKNANTKVDAVSGATMSSTAIIESINQTIDIKNGKAVVAKSGINKNQLINALAVLFAGLLGLFMFFAPKKANKYRLVIQTSLVFVLGIWQGSMLSVAKISAWVLNGIPDYYQYSLLAILAMSIIIPLITGKNFYCYNVCPFGAAQDLVKQSIKVNLKIKVFKWLSHARIVILLFCFLLLVFGYASYVSLLEPFSAFKPEHANKICVAIFVVSLIMSAFISRPWCKYFCPCGAFLDLFKKN